MIKRFLKWLENERKWQETRRFMRAGALAPLKGSLVSNKAVMTPPWAK